LKLRNKMSYKLYTDKNESFECEVSVKNASLKNSMARLVVESTDGPNLVFNGKIENGKCVVPIHRLKGLLDENTSGNMHLEVIVEDTYFKPWSSAFIVEEHTSVKVHVNESKQSTKPSVSVKVAQAPVKKVKGQSVAIMELKNLCNKFGFTKRTLPRHKEDFRQLVSEYFKANPEFLPQKKQIIGMVGYLLK
jgi:hypothetical protein